MEPTEPDTTEQPAPPAPTDDAKIARLRRKARRLWRCYRVGRVIVLCNLALFLTVTLLSIHNGKSSFPDWFLILFAPMFIMGIVMAPLRYAWKSAADRLCSSAGKSGIGTFVEGLSVVEEREFACDSLVRLLPDLRASDAHLLTPQHHHILNRILNRNYWCSDTNHVWLILATLKAYEQVGSTEDLPFVERLAVGEGWAKYKASVRKAAQECLPYLQARSEQQAARQTLLRASSATGDDGANLLRPASGVNETDAQQLLRATNGDTRNQPPALP